MRLLEFTNDIFTNKTGMPTYDDMLLSPDYFAREKGKVFKIIKMSPDEYLAHCQQGFGEGNFTPEENLVKDYAQRVKEGSKMPMPVLTYELSEHGTDFSQEGRHRAYVAKALGVNVMPVMIVASSYPAHKFRDVFDEFQQSIWSKFQ